MKPCHPKRLTLPLVLLGFAFPDLSAQQTLIKTAKLRLDIRQSPFALIFKDAQGKTITEGTPPQEGTPVIFGVKKRGWWSRVVQARKVTRQEDKFILSGVTDAPPCGVDITITEKPSTIHLEMNGPPDAEALGYSFRAFAGEHFSGMGQRFNALNVRGQEIPTYDQEWTVLIPRAGAAGSQKYISAFWAADQNADFDLK